MKRARIGHSGDIDGIMRLSRPRRTARSRFARAWRSPVWRSLIVAAVILGSGGSAASADERPRHDWGQVRGVTISTHIDGQDWANDGIVATMREIREIGANWVTIHPYAGIGADGTVRFRRLEPRDRPESIARPIREAHALGLKIMIKPHLAYWGSPFRWRGEIGFDEPAEWERFWSSYEAWIVRLARVSRDADAFVVGTELGRTLGFEREWRRVIAAVRRSTDVSLTYAANWDRFTEVRFWDGLDAIGIQAYFPLTDDPEPSEAAIREGWASWMSRVRAFSRSVGRPVLFTELGYNRSTSAPARPWEAGAADVRGGPAQQACMRAALRAVEGEASVAGVFLWKWFPAPRSVGRTFQLATPEMRRVVSEAWVGEPTTPIAETVPTVPRR